jgi:IMP dehydrogenase
MDYKIYSQYSITFDDVLLSPGYSTIKPKDVVTSINIGDIKLQIPIISAAMDTVTESKMAINLALNGGLGVIHRNMSIEKQAKEVTKVHNKKFDSKIFNQVTCNKKGEIAVGAAIGVENNAYLRLQELIKSNVDIIFIDVAHAHTKTTIDFIKKAKKILKKIPLVVGNIATKEAAKDLIKAGVDVIKVGIGPGSICTTRIVTGVGIPQLSAIIDAFKVANKYNIPVIADGGIKTSGDIAKAIAGGASACMIGSLLAGTDESPGKMINVKGKKYKSYRGMGSVGAMQKGSFDRYSQEETKNAEKLVAEGVEGMVPYKGTTKNVVYQLVGGLRSSMGYTGHKTIKKMQNNCKFVFISKAGARESNVHDVLV